MASLLAGQALAAFVAGMGPSTGFDGGSFVAGVARLHSQSPTLLFGMLVYAFLVSPIAGLIKLERLVPEYNLEVVSLGFILAAVLLVPGVVQAVLEVLLSPETMSIVGLMNFASGNP
jgi:hypothetical protein